MSPGPITETRGRGVRTSALWLSLPLVLCACGGDDDADREGQTSSGAEAVDEAAEMPDIRPPDFDGVQSVELLGLDRFRLTWAPATDDVTPQDRIRYRVYHVVEPYRELDDDATALFTSAPGATEATLAHDAPPGRFYVRALDEAGNQSPPTTGLLQRPQRPRIRAVDGTLAARITGCHALASRRAICVGEEGFAALWAEDRWSMLESGVITPLRIAATPSGVFVYSDVGHLFLLNDDGLDLVDLAFVRRTPELPLRQFTADGLGLRYWIDADGRVFVGADREFLPMPRPLALPGDVCRSLRGMVFSPVVGFAVCTEGAVYTTNPATPGVFWQSLTPNADFALEQGLDGVVADGDATGVLFDRTGVRSVSVGGWRPMLLTNWRQPGIHPMDIPDDPPPVSRIGQVTQRPGGLEVVSDLGLLTEVGDGWRVVRGTEGPLVGAIDHAGDRLLIYDDGSVARFARGRRDWILPPSLRGFAFGTMVSDGRSLALRDGSDGGLFAWDGGRWRGVARGPSADEQWVGLAAAPGADLHVFGARGTVGAIWRVAGSTWTAATWLYEPPPPPPPRGAVAVVDGAGLEFEGPPPLAGVTASQTSAPTPPPEPIVHVSLAGTRGVAVSERQVWWRLAAGWRLLGTRSGSLTGALLDAGDTYVIIEDGRPVRCWRQQCGEPVLQPDGGPSRVVALLPVDGGVDVVDASGAVFRFEAATLPPGDPLIDPVVETPVGVWREVVGVGSRAERLVARVRFGGVDALLERGGGVYERRGDMWELQVEVPDAIALLAAGETWGILTESGMVLLGEVRPVTRANP